MRKARSIFQNIYLSEETTEEKVDAIRKVIGMETHNSFTKQEFINALGWLLNEHPKHNGWIPCSERLPEVEADVLLSLRSLDVYCGFRANTEGCFYIEGMGYVQNKNIIAWQPLPQPYKAGD